MSLLSFPRAIKAYRETLIELQQGQGVENELGLRRAFETLLTEVGKMVGWTLVAEPQRNNIRPDAKMVDDARQILGLWEAKDPKDKLEVEIQKKIASGYKLYNIIFEDTRQGILYQNKQRVGVYNLTSDSELTDLLRAFFGHTEPEYLEFGAAVQDFRERVPEIAKSLLEKIQTERKERNTTFTTAYAAFKLVCQNSIDATISDAEIDEMLVQHLLSERMFRKIFDNPDFTRRNVIANEIEKVIDALTSRNFNRSDFLKSLDKFYVAIERSASRIGDSVLDEDSYQAKQTFLNFVYERFFQGYAVKQADTHGIVYTPQPIVDFMCASVEAVLQREFGRSINDQGVQLLDPCTGTGNFIVNLMRRIKADKLAYKYKNDLFANEIMLLPYYIASLNIEHEYYQRTHNYQPFEGLCFVDTLTLEGIQQQLTGFNERNSERIDRQQQAQLMVIIGNPPYNVGQVSENDNNKNRKYPFIDKRVSTTYAHDSQASNVNKLSDAYVKFFRWASDRLHGQDGIVCYVSNNSFVEAIAFDGMRKNLMEDFTQIWHLDLGGNSRKATSGVGNVFDIRVGVGITIAIKASQNEARGLWYYKVPDELSKTAKLDYLSKHKDADGIPWQELAPDEATHQWLTEGMRPEFATYLPMGSKTAKNAKESIAVTTIFKNYSLGVNTNRDDWAYDFDREDLIQKISRTIETYNSEVDRWHRRGDESRTLDNFVTYDDTRIKWSESLKANLARKIYIQNDNTRIRTSLYRPFTKQFLYFERLLNERVYQMPQIFPTPATENENRVIVLPGIGNRKEYGVLITSIIPNLELGFEKAQCFPLYTYDVDGSNRRDNITDWALAQFQGQYGANVTKDDIFSYVYGVLHMPDYRTHFAENLKRELPRIPLVADRAEFEAVVAAGQRLAVLHIGYEGMQEFPLQTMVSDQVPFSQRVTKMTLSRDRTSLVVNESLQLLGIPAGTFDYRLGNRSALDWVIDQYQVTTDKRSNITSDPNRRDDPGYIVKLVGQVIAVSLETQAIVAGLPRLKIGTTA